MDKNIKASFDNSSGNSGETPDFVPVGLMGVGKTTVGRRLAKRLNLDFVDADEEIERAAGLTVEEIFDRFGEPYFRDGERRVITRLLDGKRQIIATGGGAFMNDETRALILEKAKILAELAVVRNPVYATAHIHVMGNDSPHDTTVEHIIEALQR